VASAGSPWLSCFLWVRFVGYSAAASDSSTVIAFNAVAGAARIATTCQHCRFATRYNFKESPFATRSHIHPPSRPITGTADRLAGPITKAAAIAGHPFITIEAGTVSVGAEGILGIVVEVDPGFEVESRISAGTGLQVASSTTAIAATSDCPAFDTNSRLAAIALGRPAADRSFLEGLVVGWIEEPVRWS